MDATRGLSMRMCVAVVALGAIALFLYRFYVGTRYHALTAETERFRDMMGGFPETRYRNDDYIAPTVPMPPGGIQEFEDRPVQWKTMPHTKVGLFEHHTPKSV